MSQGAHEEMPQRRDGGANGQHRQSCRKVLATHSVPDLRLDVPNVSLQAGDLAFQLRDLELEAEAAGDLVVEVAHVVLQGSERGLEAIDSLAESPEFSAHVCAGRGGVLDVRGRLADRRGRSAAAGHCTADRSSYKACHGPAHPRFPHPPIAHPADCSVKGRRGGVIRLHKTTLVTGIASVSEYLREPIHAAFTQVGAA
jgi:hypothetical protein